MHVTKFDRITFAFCFCLSFYNSQFWVLYIRHTIQYLCFQYVEHVRSIRIPIRTLYSMQSEYFVSEARARTAVSRPGSLYSKTNRTKVGSRPWHILWTNRTGSKGSIVFSLNYCLLQHKALKSRQII